MEKNWKKIYFSGEEYKVVIARDILAESGISAVIMNQRDSSYTTFGDVELYVEAQDEAQAVQILEQLIKGEL